MRFLWVSDERVLIGPGGQAHSFFPQQFAFFAEQLPEVTELVVWGRRVAVPAEHDTTTLFPCPARVGHCNVRYAGPLAESFKVGDWPKLFIRSFWAFRREVRQADVVYVRFPNNYPCLAYHLVRQRHVRVMHMLGNPRQTVPIVLPGLRWTAGILARYGRKWATRADVTSFVSGALREEYGAECPHALVTNACSIRRHQIVPQRQAGVNVSPVILYLGRLSREKGVMVLVEALAHVVRHVDAQLHVIGAGIGTAVMRGEMEECAAQLGMADRITWQGRVPPGEPFFAVMRSADVIVLPSFSEGLPSVIPEALSQGLPVVASAVGGIPELLTDGETGLLVPPGDPLALAAAIQRMLTDFPLRERVIRQGLAVAAEACMENQAGQLTAAIAAVIRERRGGPRPPAAAVV